MPKEFGVPVEPGHPLFDIDWSVGLKGAYTHTNQGSSFVKTLTPEFTAVHDGLRADLRLNGGADLAQRSGGNIELSGLRLGISGTAPIDSVTNVTGNAALTLSQELPGLPGSSAQVIRPPRIVTGTLGAGIDRQFGRFNVGIAGEATRTIYGPSERVLTGITDNSDQNYWATEASLRVGYQMTPNFEVFGEGTIGRDLFDMPSASLMRRQDGTQRELRAGVTGNWNTVLSATASVGVGDYVFDDAALGSVTTRLYDASVTYRPDPTLGLTAGLSTTISPPGADAAGTAKIEHVAKASADYTVNSWLRLRASANWGLSLFEGSGETERRHGIGAGADYKVNDHTAISADYGFAHRDNSSSGVLDSHSVTLGVTLKR